MTRPTRVLVTGVGGDLGQALVKALRLTHAPVEVYGCDMDSRSVGEVFVDEFCVVPPAHDSDHYVEALDRVCRSFEVDAVVPSSEPEIEVLSRLGRLPCGSPVICQPADWFETHADKLSCMEALKGHVDLAQFADGADPDQVERIIDQEGFPLVVKPRRSSGARSVVIAHDDQELAAALANTGSPFVQKFIDEEMGEFTVGVFSCDAFEAMICFRRELGPVGCSWFAESVDDDAILQYARQVAHAAQGNGAFNIQVRKSSKGVRLLEINPRFSSLVAARALCGFRDLEWSIELASGRVPAKPSEPFRHIGFRRFVHEVVDLGDGYGTVSAWSPRPAM